MYCTLLFESSTNFVLLIQTNTAAYMSRYSPNDIYVES